MSDMLGHDEIVQLVTEMEINPLSPVNFEHFSFNAKRFFSPIGSKYQEYTRLGYNRLSIICGFSKENRPDFNYCQELIIEEVKIKNGFRKYKRGIEVKFNKTNRIWGVDHGGVQFDYCIILNEMFYISDIMRFGTREFPYEKFFLKL